jgi:hypothetical protein
MCISTLLKKGNLKIRAISFTTGIQHLALSIQQQRKKEVGCSLMLRVINFVRQYKTIRTYYTKKHPQPSHIKLAQGRKVEQRTRKEPPCLHLRPTSELALLQLQTNLPKKKILSMHTSLSEHARTLRDWMM